MVETTSNNLKLLHIESQLWDWMSYGKSSFELISLSAVSWVHSRKINSSWKQLWKLLESHYSIALPVKTCEVSMPENCKPTEQHAMSVKIKKASFYADYTAFIEDIISCGYAKKGGSKNICYSIAKFGAFHTMACTIQESSDSEL